MVYPDIVLLDLVGPLQVFSHAQDSKTQDNGYECAVVSVGGDMTPTNTVVSIPTLSVSEVSKRDIHTLVVVGGDGAVRGMRDPVLVKAVQELSENAARICSVCSGALIVGAAGLLHGRRAVTHWNDCNMLAEEFPSVRVELDPIFIKDGNTWTSAGITAGIDMALAITSEDLGRQSALETARSMVAQMVRSGGQSQYSPTLGRQLADRAGRFEGLHSWVADNIASTLTVEKLAEQIGMSARNFARAYTNTMGKTPAKAVEAMRIESAKDFLESTPMSVKEIAVACGFKDEDRMRRAFLRTLNVSPSEYRRNFQVL
ncbi:MAG: helix-turn-helix domain-containing protein [Pseudomonadota bacterium]